MRLSSRILASVVASDFDRAAVLYERYQVPFSDLISREIVKLASILPAQDVLDVGTGTGPAALAAARIVGTKGSVTGIDISKGMLAIAKRKASAEGLTRLRFEEMDALSLDFPDGSFDAAISNLGIPTHHFDEAMSEIFRVLKGGGTLCFAEVTQLSPAWSTLSEILLRHRVRLGPPALSTRRKARLQLQQDAARFRLSGFADYLKSLGFLKVRTVLSNIRVTRAPSEGTLKLFVAREQPEYSAMPEESKRRFREEAQRRLEALQSRSLAKIGRPVRLWVAKKPSAREL